MRLYKEHSFIPRIEFSQSKLGTCDSYEAKDILRPCLWIATFVISVEHIHLKIC